MNNYFIRRISSQKNKKYTHKYYDKNDNIITYNSIKEHLEGFYIHLNNEFLRNESVKSF